MKLPDISNQIPLSPSSSLQARVRDAEIASDDEKLRKAAQGFEALFLNQVLKSARAASLGEALGESSGMETTETMLDTALSDLGAGRAGLGLADAIYWQFSRNGSSA